MVTIKKLRENEATFKAIFEYAVDGMLIAEPKTKKFILANRAMYEITGYTPEELIKLDVTKIHPRKDLPYIKKIFTAQASGKIKTAKNIPILRKDQQITYCDIKSSTVVLNNHIYAVGIFRDITQQKAIEAALRESEARYKSLFENMYSAVAVYEAIDNGNNFIFKDFNAAGETIEQIKREHVIGKKITEVFPGVEQFGLLKILKKIWRTGKSEHLPAAYYNDGNHQGWRENWVYKSPNGEIIAVYNDVTEEKKAEETLRNSEARFHSLFDHAPIGLLEFDLSELKKLLQKETPLTSETIISNIKISNMNKTALNFSNASSITEFRNVFASLFTKNAYAAAQEMIKALMQGKNYFEIEMITRTVGGQEKNILTRYIIPPGHKQKWDRIIITVADITAQKQHQLLLESQVEKQTKSLKLANQALKYSEERYKLLASISPVAIFHLDTQGNCLYANKEFTDMTGLTVKEAYTNGGWEQVIHPDDVNKVKKQWFDCAAAGETFQAKYRFCKPDGTITWVLAQTVPALNADNSVNGYVGTFTNITEQCQIEEKMRLQKKQIAKIGQVNALNEVASSLAHQLNQPLTVLSSYAQMLKKCNYCTKDCDKANKIIASAKRASNIIHSMREFFGNSVLDKTIVDLHALITNCVQLLINDSDDVKKTNTNFHFAKDNFTVKLDKTQIEQVIMNLLQNSLEAAHDNRDLNITISTAIKDQWLTITIKDDGIGFSEHIAQKLFDPFFTTKTGGMGMGLAICRSIIEAHGGQLHATSKLGKGATFRVNLPLK